MGTEIGLSPQLSSRSLQPKDPFHRPAVGLYQRSAVQVAARRRVSPRLVRTIRETARQLGVSELTVRRRLRDGILQGVQLGGSWRLPGPGIDRIRELPEECSVEQIAQSLIVSELTVRRWIMSGQFPATKSHRVWMIKRSDLEQILGFHASAASEEASQATGS